MRALRSPHDADLPTSDLPDARRDLANSTPRRRWLRNRSQALRFGHQLANDVALVFDESVRVALIGGTDRADAAREKFEARQPLASRSGVGPIGIARAFFDFDAETRARAVFDAFARTAGTAAASSAALRLLPGPNNPLTGSTEDSKASDFADDMMLSPRPANQCGAGRMTPRD